MKQMILASTSPRRKELMALLPVDFKIRTKEIEEHIDALLTPQENVCALATQKAEAVALEYADQVVIGCDTVVAYDGQILGKPKDQEDAKRMIKLLSGNVHEVYTGVSLICHNQNIAYSFYETSKVYMKAISDKECEWYVATGEPMDKAGSYAVQGHGGLFVERIEGDYFNIVGLPVHKLYNALKALNMVSL